MINKTTLNKHTKETLIECILRLSPLSKKDFVITLNGILDIQSIKQNSDNIDNFIKAATQFNDYYEHLKEKYNLPTPCSLPHLHKTITSTEYDKLANLEIEKHKLFKKI